MQTQNKKNMIKHSSAVLFPIQKNNNEQKSSGQEKKKAPTCSWKAMSPPMLSSLARAWFELFKGITANPFKEF